MEELKENVEVVRIDGKRVGEYYTNMSGHLVYQTRRIEKKNQFMHIIQGFGIQADIINRFKLEDPEGIINVTFYTKSRGVLYYQSSVATWINKAVEKDFGFGKQLLLSIDDMELINDKGGSYD